MNDYDVIIAGASLGGVMAAYSLASNNHKVLLIEETDWIGGQLTSQGVPSDEHRFIEDTGATKTYYEFRENVRKFYRENPNVKEEIKKTKIFNPGGGWVSRNAHEPVLAQKLLTEMLNPFVKNKNLEIIFNSTIISANFNNEEVYDVTLNVDNIKKTYKAKFFIDATDN